MGKDDWYRNKGWNEQIEADFETRLKRARDKSQYLRIQSNYLTKTHPHIALELLERYFDLGEHFDYVQAYVDRANAFISLGEKEEAIASFQAALVREDIYPNLLTNAYVDLPFFIAVRGVKQKYNDAMQILDKYRHRLRFSIDRYKWNATKSIILSSLGSDKEATKFAQAAVAAAEEKKSGFKYYPKIGLVSEDKTDKKIYRQIKKNCNPGYLSHSFNNSTGVSFVQIVSSLNLEAECANYLQKLKCHHSLNPLRNLSHA